MRIINIFADPIENNYPQFLLEFNSANKRTSNDFMKGFKWRKLKKEFNK